VREIVIVSGKGGTGKTSLTAALAILSGRQVLVDCDVDAANLHLLLEPSVEETHEFTGGLRARVESELCDACGRCGELCRFDAVRLADKASIDALRCEGCGVCEWNCPREAISLHPAICGRWRRSTTRAGPMFHARLEPSQENSGRLVALLRREARRLAEESGAAQVLIDGPPGTGCPVISSLTGADYAVAVTEPTQSGRADLERLAAVADHFRIPVGVVVNKADINSGAAAAIEAWARETGRDILGRIGYHPAFVQAQLAGQTVLENGGRELREAIESVWRNLRNALDRRLSPFTVVQ
jgi:MinD superfamily P-loop ATPase